MDANTEHSGDTYSIRISDELVEKTASKLQSFLMKEQGVLYPQPAVSGAVRTWMERQIDDLTEGLSELLATPGRKESREFRRILEESVAVRAGHESLTAKQPVQAESSVFTGFRPFSADRLAAMASHIVAQGKDIYKTKLNKLLFYSDFINFHLHGHSISGAKYIHVPFGPVPQQYGDVLAQLADAGRVNLERSGQGVLLKPVPDSSAAGLDPNELETIEWVLKNYGELTSSEISDLSHSEKAYRFTRPGEEIAYRYAAFFETLPVKREH